MTALATDVLTQLQNLPPLGTTTIWVMLFLCVFCTGLAKSIIEGSLNGIVFLFLGMLCGTYVSVHALRYADVLVFGRTELTDATLASLIGIGCSIIPTIFVMRLLNSES
jgi:DMSO/TMAO reductase YedYZ heme-binding membrane subunit